MGGYLSSPNTDIEAEDKTVEGLSYGVSSMQGWRISQEVSAGLPLKAVADTTFKTHLR